MAYQAFIFLLAVAVAFFGHVAVDTNNRVSEVAEYLMLDAENKSLRLGLENACLRGEADEK